MRKGIRLDADTEALLKALAQRSGKSESEVVRDAIHLFARTTLDSREDVDVYTKVSDLVGVVTDYSAISAHEHKNSYRAAMKKKHCR